MANLDSDLALALCAHSITSYPLKATGVHMHVDAHRRTDAKRYAVSHGLQLGYPMMRTGARERI